MSWHFLKIKVLHDESKKITCYFLYSTNYLMTSTIAPQYIVMCAWVGGVVIGWGGKWYKEERG
jgi:hypothetical protein